MCQFQVSQKRSERRHERDLVGIPLKDLIALVEALEKRKIGFQLVAGFA